MVKCHIRNSTVVMAKRITKVTTKKGDDGTTGMADGTRVTKSNLLIKAIGELDELNSWIGLLCSLNEIKEVLNAMSLYLGMEIPNWPPENIVEMSKKLEENN